MPPLNAVRTGQFVSLDDIIYILGWDPNQQDVYVLDLAGGKQWKACASMLEPRKRFACDVLDGKIYVFGGSIDPAQGRVIPVGGSEVYDPQKNVWSAITPMPSLRENHSVITVSDEMFIHGGFHFGYGFDVVDSYPKLLPHEASFWEIYYLVKDNWRRVEPFGCTFLIVFSWHKESSIWRLMTASLYRIIKNKCLDTSGFDFVRCACTRC